MSETNCPWTPKSKEEYDLILKEVFGTSRITYSSAPAPTNSTYLPGGTLLTMNGHTTGRVAKSGSDPWGRYSWYQLRGQCDKGILIICAYRVCQSQLGVAGPTTAYQQQYSLMRAAGFVAPNPRQQVLKDISDLIESHRAEGYRPIVMMDANGDYNATTGRDSALQLFLHDNNLINPFYDKFQTSPRTYAYGSRRIDYIFTDPICAHAITAVGYLGTHQGAYSDHCLAYIDVDERRMFNGVLNRPVHHHSREITLAQDDKVLQFTKDFTDKLNEHSVQGLMMKLADGFTVHGALVKNVEVYHALYKEFIDLARSTSKKAGKRKFGYMRSSELTI